MKACLVDWQDGNLIIPWMTFDSIEEALRVRKESHSSFPVWVAEYDETKPVKSVPTRRAQFEKEYRNERVQAFEPLAAAKPFYEMESHYGHAL